MVLLPVLSLLLVAVGVVHRSRLAPPRSSRSVVVVLCLRWSSVVAPLVQLGSFHTQIGVRRRGRMAGNQKRATVSREQDEWERRGGVAVREGMSG